MKVECADGDVEQGSNTHQGSKAVWRRRKANPGQGEPGPVKISSLRAVRELSEVQSNVHCVNCSLAETEQ
jgi:hypothetical protein